jgi:hypothetical protein
MLWTPYDNYTDDELIRIADNSDSLLVRALAERLDMRNQELKETQHETDTNPTASDSDQ